MNYLKLKSKEEVLILSNKIKNNEEVCNYFKFKKNNFFDILLKELEIDKNKFYQKYYYHNGKLHISKSNFGYFLISNIGLVLFKDDSNDFKNKIFSSLSSQYELLQTIISKIDELKNIENVFNINSFEYEQLMNLSIVFFHNYLFYLELLCKYYIASNKGVCDNTHSLSKLLEDVKEIMFNKNQNNSLFHFYIFSEIENVVSYIKNIPGFKEQFVKYNDNDNDSTIIKIDDLDDIFNLVNVSYDIICSYKFNNNCQYMEQGFYEKKLAFAKDTEEKEIFAKKYKYLIDINEKYKG